MKKRLGRLILILCWVIPGLSFADSTQVVAPTVQNMYIEAESKNNPVTQEMYPTTVCPDDPICPSISGSIPSGSSPNRDCPEECIVTRNPEELPSNADPRTVRIKDATCPSGYIAGGFFNVQKELKHSDVIEVVTNMDMPRYNTLKDSPGVSCNADGTNLIPEYSKCDPVGTSPRWSNGDATDLYPNYMGLVVKIVNTRGSVSCYSDSNCNYATSCTSFAAAAVQYSKIFYPAQKMYCNTPKGIYETGYFAPISVYCVRSKATWKPVNN